MRQLYLLALVLIFLTGCEKYYDNKYTEHIKADGIFNDTLIEVNHDVTEKTFEINYTESLLGKRVVYLTFAIGCDNAQPQNCFYIDMEIYINGVQNKVNAKNIASAINDVTDWNEDLGDVFSIMNCSDGSCVAKLSSFDDSNANFSIEANNKGDWLFLEGYVNQYPMSTFGTQVEDPKAENINFDIAVKINN